MTKMWISFIGIALMFLSVIVTIFAREKLSGIIQKMLLSLSFISMIVAGFIVFIIVFSGPVD